MVSVAGRVEIVVAVTPPFSAPYPRTTAPATRASGMGSISPRGSTGAPKCSRLLAFRPAWYERLVTERPFQFEWDEAKADANASKHGVSFELASTIFFDPNLITVADVEHSEAEERWFSVGTASNGVLLAGVYLWSDNNPAPTTVRLIYATHAAPAESAPHPVRRRSHILVSVTRD